MIELAEIIKALTGCKSGLIHKSLLPNDPRQSQPDIRLVKEAMGWEPRITLREGLKPTIAFFEALLRGITVINRMRKNPPTTTPEDRMIDAFEPPAPLQTAVLFLVFNRPDTTAQVFEAIRKAKPPRLYVAADGPRANRAGEAESVAKVREIATAVDWPCQLKTLFRTENVGCQFGPRGGIDWLFENEDYGIILEDDCLPSQSFFWFCEEMLKRYREDESIMAITGTNIINQLTFDGDYFFSKYPLMWGWASWRRAWVKYDPDLADWKNLRKGRWLKSLDLGGLPFESTWKQIFDRTVQLGKDATWWDYQWIYSCWVSDGLTIAPAVNLIRNIGYSSDATHTKGDHPILSNLIANETNFPIVSPKIIAVNQQADLFISRIWFGVGWISLFKSMLMRFPGLRQINTLRKKFSENEKTY